MPELLKISQFFFAILTHNANVKRVFSLKQVHYTKERSMLNVEPLRGLLFLQNNFKGISCIDFHTFLKIQSTEKYEWAHKKEDD
jgi:hypothetical protein